MTERFDEAFAAIDPSRQGTLPDEELGLLLTAVRNGEPWDRAIERLDLPTLSGKRGWFTDAAKADFYLTLDTPSCAAALDIGGGSGVISRQLATKFERVMVVERHGGWCEFMRERFRQAGVADRIDVIEGSGFDTARWSHDFDLAVVNGVLEWVATGSEPVARRGSPRDAQLAFLRAVHHALRPGGRIGVAIENRFYIDHFRGASPHGEPPYVALLPRWLADTVHRRLRGVPYRTWVYGAKGYSALLRDAGFADVHVQAALPDYYNPREVADLSDTERIRRYMPAGKLRGAVFGVLGALRLLGRVAHSFYIAGRKPT